MEEQNSIYLQRLCGAVKQVQIEASQTNEFLVKDGRSPLQLCGRYEDIFSHRYKTSALSLLKKKTGFWGVVKEISRKEALTRIKNLQYTETDLGRCRAWIRLALNENSLVAYITSLQSNPELLARYYEPQAFLRDADLIEAAINVLSGLDTIKFELTLDTSSLEIDIAPDAFVPADKLSRLMALELARAIQQQPSEPVMIERKPLRKKRRKNKKFDSPNTDTDSAELPDSESDYGSLLKPPRTQPLSLGKEANGDRSSLPWYSSSFEHSHGALFTDSSFHKDSPSSDSKGYSLSTSAPPARSVFPKFSRESSPISPTLEQIEEISELILVENKSKNIDLLSPILSSPTADTITPQEGNSQDISTPRDQDTQATKLDFEDETPTTTNNSEITEEFFLQETEPNIVQEKTFLSLELSPTEDKVQSPTIYKDFPSPFTPLVSQSLPIQTFLTADAVTKHTTNGRIGTPNSLSANSNTSSEDFYSLNGEWDIIGNEEMELSHENLKSAPLFENRFTDDYFMQEINVDKLTQNQVYSTLKKIKEELKTVKPENPSHKILVHTLVKLRIRRLEMEDGKMPNKRGEWKELKIFGHNLELHSGGKNPPKMCEICGKNFGPITLPKQKWGECRDCTLSLHVACVKRIPSACPSQSNPKLILDITQEFGLLLQKFKCKNCSRQIGIGARDEPRLCRYTGLYFCQNCYSITPTPLPAKIIHDWDFRARGVSLSSYLTLKILYSAPSINLQQNNPLIYSYENNLGECLTIRKKLKQMYQFLIVCQKAKDHGLLAVHQGMLHDHIWLDTEPWSIEDLFAVNDGRFLPALRNFFSSWDWHIRQCPRCSGNGHFCMECVSDDILFPWDQLAISCQNCGVLSHSHCGSEKGCSKCNMRARRMRTEIS